MEDKISELASALIKKYRQHRLKSAFTVAISGIDAAGKGYISKLLKEGIEANGYRVALIHTDPWQNPFDIILLERILLLKQQYLPYFDFKIWVDCSFETGLQRAIQRNVEKLGEEIYYRTTKRSITPPGIIILKKTIL